MNRYSAKIFFIVSGTYTIKMGYKQQTIILIDHNGNLVTNEKQIIKEFI